MSFKIKDFSIKAFNNDVNHSGDLQDKYYKWEMYRDSISQGIVSRLAGADRGMTAIVFAAGECNDIDLGYLLEEFDAITLTDVDKNSIIEGISRQELTDKQKSRITIAQREYTGLSTSGFFETLADMASQHQSVQSIIDHIKIIGDVYNTPENFDEYKHMYDYAISCPVYTQMEVLIKILKQFNVYTDKEIDTINKAAYSSMPIIIKRYNDLLLSTVKQGGHIAVLTDVVEIPNDSDMIAQLQSRLDKTNVDKDELLEFVHDYGLELGRIGYGHLIFSIVDAQYSFYLWPFDEYKQYLVLIVYGKKEQ